MWGLAMGRLALEVRAHVAELPRKVGWLGHDMMSVGRRREKGRSEGGEALLGDSELGDRRRQRRSRAHCHWTLPSQPSHETGERTRSGAHDSDGSCTSVSCSVEALPCAQAARHWLQMFYRATRLREFPPSIRGHDHGSHERYLRPRKVQALGEDEAGVGRDTLLGPDESGRRRVGIRRWCRGGARRCADCADFRRRYALQQRREISAELTSTRTRARGYTPSTSTSNDHPLKSSRSHWSGHPRS